jgi:serpin B
MRPRKSVFVVVGMALFHAALIGSTSAADDTVAANAVNALGVDLLSRVAKPNENALISPYSIQSALAMTYAGAAGETKAEMARVLHYPVDEVELHRSFAAFRRELDAIHEKIMGGVNPSPTQNDSSDLFTLEVANRLYGQSGFVFRPAFLSLLKENYGAPLQEVDFAKTAESVGSDINRWVAEVTHDRIRDIISPGALNVETKLVVVNAMYLKAPWAEAFDRLATKKERFFVDGKNPEDVRTMLGEGDYGYRRDDGFRAITVSYVGEELQLLILLPNRNNGLAALEAKLTPKMLAQCAHASKAKLILHLPLLKFETPGVPLGATLQALGMKRAFDQPRFSADFDRMALPVPGKYLNLSDVFHKTFLALDETGTEAAAATADIVLLSPLGVGSEEPKPKEVKVDHPFLFAIQHRASGACLFLGRVVDPR